MLHFDRSTLKQRYSERILKCATSGFLTALVCTKFVFGRGSVPFPVLVAYNAPQDCLAGLRGLLLKGIGRQRETGEKKGNGKEGEGTGRTAPLLKFLNPPLQFIQRSLNLYFLWHLFDSLTA